VVFGDPEAIQNTTPSPFQGVPFHWLCDDPAVEDSELIRATAIVKAGF
jgi:hypothetical protein